MKRITLKIFFFLFLSICSYAQIDNYSYKRKLNTIDKENFYSIPLTPEVTAHSKSNLTDIRLYSISENDTIEIPYLIESRGDKTEQKSVDFELINPVSNLKCCSYVTLKMNKKRVINTIHLDVSESNFDKILTIEGSNDNKQWFTIKDHLRIVGVSLRDISTTYTDENGKEIIIHPASNVTTTDGRFKFTNLSFPSSEFSYFRIKFDDDNSKRITINNASAYESTTTKGKYTELKIKKQSQTENKKNKKSETIIELDNTHWLSHLSIDVKNKSDYYRNINIYASNGTYSSEKGIKETWELISSGVISSKFDNLFLLNEHRSNKLKIEVINYDDTPILLNKITVFSENRSLIAKLPKSENVYLCYGKEYDNAPIYDLVHFKENIPVSMQALGYASEQIKIAPLEKKSALVTTKTWLWIAIGAVIVMIGYFALSMLRKEQE